LDSLTTVAAEDLSRLGFKPTPQGGVYFSYNDPIRRGQAGKPCGRDGEMGQPPKVKPEWALLSEIGSLLRGKRHDAGPVAFFPPFPTGGVSDHSLIGLPGRASHRAHGDGKRPRYNDRVSNVAALAGPNRMFLFREGAPHEIAGLERRLVQAFSA